jgi:membrane protease subunit HflK
MQQIMQSTSKVVVDQKAGNNLLYLPLDKLIGAGATSTAPVTIEAPRASTTEQTVVTPDPRRDLRNR